MPSHFATNEASAEALLNPPWAGIPANGPILRPADAAAYYGISLTTYYDLIKASEVPPFVKLSSRARASGVPRVWLDATIAARVAAARVR